MSKCLVCNIPLNILEGLDIEFSYLVESDLDVKMNELLEKTNIDIQNISFKYPFVFMHEYSEEEMNVITHTLKSNQVNAIYAVSTPHNLQWTLNDLFNELLEEHEIFQTMNELQELMKELIPAMNQNQEIKLLLMEAFIILQNKNLIQMKQMIQKLNNIKKSD